jgi:abnormal spindle-like microcephaly-associated protein
MRVREFPVKIRSIFFLQVVAAFLRDRMRGEGDVMRHLATYGYRLTFEQSGRAELDMVVNNLAMDLRSGVRLCRLAELLTGVHKAAAN